MNDILGRPIDWDAYEREEEELAASARKVETIDIGTYGCKPKNPQDCIYGGNNSCVSPSGDSICGGCLDDCGGYVLCIEPLQK
jgi:hypothetical protein